MKKLLFSAIAVALAFGASAQTSKEDVRIYINPGHGSWGPNNRHLATIGHNPISTENPDTTDFFESNTNLQKGLQVLHMLHEYGVPFDPTKNQTNDNPNRIGAALDLSQNLVMSHVKCGPYPYSNVKDEELGYIPDDQKNDFNRNLSEIAAEVDANNFDMFISIHSNAASDGNTTNYLYFAYDSKILKSDGTPKDGYETEGAALKAAAIEMSRCGWNHRILDRHTKWSHYDYTMTAADVAAGKGKIGYQTLGVLDHDVPGYLVEGYFHTYQPARHRAMNFDVDQLEGRDYARGVADYFGWEKESYGAIYGIVRDKYTKFSDDVYTPKGGTSDVYKPLNGVDVTLKDSEGNVVDTYKTDVNYNGAFVFKKVQPGDYTVEFSHPAYKSDVYANTNATTQPAPLAVTVKAAVTAYPEAFLVDTGYVAPTTVYVNYPDSLADKAGFALADEINFAAEYTNYAALEGKKVRRTIVRDNNEYILAFDAANAPYVYVFDTDTKELKKTLGTTAAVGDIYKLSDIAMTADGYLVGINKCNQAYGGANNVTAYKWENDDNGVPEGEAVIWWTNNFGGNYNNAYAGESVVYDGTLADGKMIYTASTTASNGNTRLVIVSISEGEYLGYMRNNQDGQYIATSYFGTDYKMTLSPRADDQIIFNSATVQPFEIKLNPTDAKVPTILAQLGEGTLGKASVGESYFKYAGKDLMVAPSVTDGKVDGVKLIDITDGLDNATEILTNGTTAIDAAEFASITANAELALTIDDVTGYTTKADIELFLNVDGKVSKFTNAGVKQPVYSGVYAYDLNVDEEGNVSFKLNNKSHNVDLVLTPAEGNTNATEDVVYNLGALAAGENTYKVDLEALTGDYNWSVVVANKTIATGDIIATMNTWGAGSTYYRGGIAVENNPESEYFATTYLGVGRSKGIFLLDPMYQVQEDAPYWVGKFNTGNASSTFRGALYNDKFYLTDWSDAYPGIWIFDPANPTAINNIFAGATNDGKGKLTIDGVAVGGGSTGVAFTGSGDDRKMFIYVEDLPTSNAGNKLYRYDIGADDVWGAKAPTQLTTASAKLVNTNTGMLGSALHNVVFCSQSRDAGQNNTGVPAFLVINEAGDIIFNGGDLNATLTGCRGGGMALNADENRFAIVDASAAIQVYDVEWAENVPSFTHVASIPTNDQEICQMAFDYAGNLHCINRKHGYYVHAVPGVAKDVTTPAKAELLIKGTETGVEDVTIEEVDEDAPVEYYNLQGVKVENPSNGIFIKVQGKKSEKVYIK